MLEAIQPVNDGVYLVTELVADWVRHEIGEEIVRESAPSALADGPGELLEQISSALDVGLHLGLGERREQLGREGVELLGVDAIPDPALSSMAARADHHVHPLITNARSSVGGVNYNLRRPPTPAIAQANR